MPPPDPRAPSSPSAAPASPGVAGRAGNGAEGRTEPGPATAWPPGGGAAPAAASGVAAGAAGPAGPIDVGRPYLQAILAHWRFAALVVLAVLVGTLLALGRRSPAYEATAELLVAPVEPADASFTGLSVIKELGDPTRTIQTAAALVEDRAIAEEAADRLGDEWTDGRVLSAIDVSPQGQTNVLEVTASTDDPDEAAAVANAYAQAVVDVRNEALEGDVGVAIDRLRAELEVTAPEATLTQEGLRRRISELELLRVNGDPTVSFAEPAAVPADATSLPSWAILAVALVAALVVAPAVALLAELVGPRRARSDADVAEAVGAPILAHVPRAPRSSRRSRRSGPRADAVATAYRRLAVLIELARPPRRTLLVVSPSRGDGRTSVVHNLARELERPGVTVRVVPVPDADTDTDAFADAPPPPADVVVVDTPPLLGSPDALRLAATADTILVVARRGHTRLADLTRAADLLTTVGTPPTAAILLDARS